MSLTVCQSQPSSRATAATARRSRPTCSVSQRPARWVTEQRCPAIRWSLVVHDRCGHSGSGHVRRTLCQASTTGLPNAGRSVSLTTRWPLIQPRAPQVGQSCCQCSGEPTCTTNGPASPRDSTPRTTTSGRPTSSSHIRVGSVSTGVLPVQGSWSKPTLAGPLPRTPSRHARRPQPDTPCPPDRQQPQGPSCQTHGRSEPKLQRNKYGISVLHSPLTRRFTPPWRV